MAERLKQESWNLRSHAEKLQLEVERTLEEKAWKQNMRSGSVSVME